MDIGRLNSVLRAVRLRNGWRQVDVARAAGVSRTSVVRSEHQGIGSLRLTTIQRIAVALDIRLDLMARWHGGDLDRLLRSGHSAMHELVGRSLAAGGWIVRPEVSFSIYGERGVIDILALHPASRVLLVVELKTEIVDIQALIGGVDRYRRLAPRIAPDLGWQADSVSAWVVVRETPTNRRRLARHATVLRAAFPDDGRVMRRWLSRPSSSVRALSFLSDDRHRDLSATSTGIRRVRRTSSSLVGSHPSADAASAAAESRAEGHESAHLIEKSRGSTR